MRVAIFTMFLVLGAPLGVLGSAETAASGPRLVILPPWRDGAAIVTASGGRIIGPERAPFALLVDPPDAGFDTAVRQAGAWAVLDGGLLAQICGV